MVAAAVVAVRDVACDADGVAAAARDDDGVGVVDDDAWDDGAGSRVGGVRDALAADHVGRAVDDGPSQAEGCACVTPVVVVLGKLTKELIYFFINRYHSRNPI